MNTPQDFIGWALIRSGRWKKRFSLKSWWKPAWKNGRTSGRFTARLSGKRAGSAGALAVSTQPAAWLEENRPQGFTAFTLPAAHQKQMRTRNSLERINRECRTSN